MYIIIFFIISFLHATFSIVAVNTNTGEVGSAGGSCIGNSIIISDIHPGLGVIHTQSYYLPANQIYASNLMNDGHSPEEIINLLEDNDYQNNPSIRQYGIIDIVQGINYGLLLEEECSDLPGATWSGTENSGELAECSEASISRNASYTGSNCSDWKGHINGIDYAIQGNILLNEDVLLSIEDAFVSTNGSLDQRLMAAMQGGKIPGADSRCLDEGISTLSAFIRVAKPDDINDYYMDLNVNSVIPYYNQTGLWIDPVDTLQVLYDNWYNDVFEYNLGDVNQDLIINILDVVIIVNFIMGDTPVDIEYYLADLNQDSIINIQDIIITINFILNS